MLASLAQAVALVGYGNGYLNGLLAEPPDLVGSNSAFQFVGALQFAKLRSKSLLDRVLRPRSEEEVIASTTADWFRYLRSNGVRQLSLALVGHSSDSPAHIAISYAGSSQWVIVASGTETAMWRSSERVIGAPEFPKGAVTNASLQEFLKEHNAALSARPDKRIWRVSFLGVVNAQPAGMGVTVPVANANLRDALDAGIAFTGKADLPFWREWLQGAREQLDSSSPRARFNDDALPTLGYSTASHALYAGAASAWVFGGMGSWNDMSFGGELQREYKEATSRLYAAVAGAVVAAANAFAVGER
ncbi:MAG TPA: hypothetical protein VE825_13555 [Terriglobales bacterium]|jgi:hypothetical protein|nr:hypothetical protein [Terriglobales bacterium]